MMDSTNTTIYSSSSLLPKVLAFQLCQRLNHTHKFQKIQTFSLLIILSLFSLYFLTSNSINFIFVFAFFVLVIISLTLSLHHSRIFLPHPSPIQLSVNKPTQNSTNHVVWSIGCDQKWKKVENSGYLVTYFNNGDIYEGEIHRGNCLGNGVYHYYKCGKYEGSWVNGKYEGYGVETWLKGSKYKGQYRNGLRHGFGVYKFYIGDIYEGEWLNGNCHGCGVYASKDGSMYVGHFKWGVKHGFGHYHYRNGDVYAGEYFADKVHGFGVYKYANGHQYEGSWHEGRRQGLGVYTFRNGEVQSGYWQNGILDNGSSRIGLSTLPFQVYSGQVSDVVQKAREACQRSYTVVTAGNNQVSKAVAAAERAANAARTAAVKAVQKRTHEEINTKKLVPYHTF
ncbi:uncharacterized protein LOC141653688 [Silene latifolia]|uniref:uncharacterized protein LOC141653688 n=1 Tax=Silene latifolia TaxID=37657 RepID=UPI003D77741E